MAPLYTRVMATDRPQFFDPATEQGVLRLSIAASLLLAAALMLDHVRLPELATRLRTAIDETLNIDKVRTGDLSGTAGTEAFTKALVSRINGG